MIKVISKRLGKEMLDVYSVQCYNIVSTVQQCLVLRKVGLSAHPYTTLRRALVLLQLCLNKVVTYPLCFHWTQPHMAQ